MKNKHFDIENLSRYLLNKMSLDEETQVQEHLDNCSECRKKLCDLRSLRYAFSDNGNKLSFRERVVLVTHSSWFRVAASLVIVAGVGFAIYFSSKPKGFPVKEGLIPETVLSIDSFPKDSPAEYFDGSDSTEVADTLTYKKILLVMR